MSSGPGRLIVTGQPLENLVGIAWDISRQRMEARAGLPEEEFSARVIIPDAERAMLELALREAIERAFSLSVSLQPNEVEALVLRAAGERGPGLEPSATEEGSYASSGQGVIEIAGGSIETLADMIESVLGKPVIDETALDGRWDARLRWDAADDSDLARALREDLGLEISTESREIEFLIIEEAILDKSWRKSDRTIPASEIAPGTNVARGLFSTRWGVSR